MGQTIQSYADEISALFETQLRIKGPSLQRQIYKSGRRLPKRVKSDARAVADAADLQKNPKLARMVDEARVSKAANRVVAHLKTVDPQKAFWDRTILVLAKISAFLIIVFIALVWAARARGLV